MRESLHVKVIFRAAHAKGGAAALAHALGVSLEDIQAWMHSSAPLPEQHFMRLLDIIAEETLRHLTERGQAMDGPSGAGS